jgi:hypothetical protein
MSKCSDLSMNVPDEGYSRNASCSLSFISTCYACFYYSRTVVSVSYICSTN